MIDLRKAEKKELFEKITPIISKILTNKNKIEKWTDREIYESTGVPQNRITEIKRFGTGNYIRPINEKNLISLIGGGMVKTEDLLEDIEVNEKERRYIQKLAVHQNEKLIDEAFLLTQIGEDPAEILRRKRISIEEENRRRTLKTK